MLIILTDIKTPDLLVTSQVWTDARGLQLMIIYEMYGNMAAYGSLELSSNMAGIVA